MAYVMDAFLQIALAFPTVVFTTALGVVLAYWLVVVAGAMDIDAFGVDFDLDLDVDTGADSLDAGGADADVDGPSASSLASLLAALRLRHAPLTVTLSVLILNSWVLSYLGARALMVDSPLPLVLSGVLIAVLALVLAVPLTSLLTRPLGPLFVVHTGVEKSSFVGQVCIVRSGSVDAKHGRAVIDDGGAGVQVRVRSEDPNSLRRGHRALLIAYDASSDIYDVEAMDELLDSAP